MGLGRVPELHADGDEEGTGMKGHVEAMERFAFLHDREPTDAEVTAFIADQLAAKADYARDCAKEMRWTETTNEGKL